MRLESREPHPIRFLTIPVGQRTKRHVSSHSQVKVWFQNRRTKHKRMQQEDEGKPGGQSMRSPGSYDDEDELIDMEMDDECPSDEEE